eukprot:1178717-Prorocentrum_minimum.AAC.1
MLRTQGSCVQSTQRHKKHVTLTMTAFDVVHFAGFYHRATCEGVWAVNVFPDQSSPQPGTQLVARTEYSQSLSFYWSPAWNILRARARHGH